MNDYRKAIGKSSIHWAPAKLNVRLKITGRRPDGYHNLGQQDALQILRILFD